MRGGSGGSCWPPDQAYDAADFVATCERFRVTPHVARNTFGRTAANTPAMRPQHRPETLGKTEPMIAEKPKSPRTDAIPGWQSLNDRVLQQSPQRTDRKCSLLPIPLPASPSSSTDVL